VRYPAIGYPYTPLLYIAMATLLVADLADLAPATAGMSYLLVMSGVPVYPFWRRRAVGGPVIGALVEQPAG
jgi:hypothetical protein